MNLRLFTQFSLTEGRPPGQRPSLSHAASRPKKSLGQHQERGDIAGKGKRRAGQNAQTGSNERVGTAPKTLRKRNNNRNKAKKKGLDEEAIKGGKS